MRKRIDVARIASEHWSQWVHRTGSIHRAKMLRFYGGMIAKHLDVKYQDEVYSLTRAALGHSA